MRQLILFIVAISLFACKKDLPAIVKPQEKKVLVLQEDDFGLFKALRKPTINPGKGHKPQDTVVIEPPPVVDTTTPYYGPRVYYVEFNGCQVNSSAWGTFYATPSNIPEDEQQRLIDTSSQHGYGEFQNFIVTRDKALFDATPERYRQKIVATPYHDFYGNTAGGIAYRGSFGTGVEAFAFTDLLLDNEKFIARTIIHEGGHTLGLPHRYYENWDSLYTVMNHMATAPFYAVRTIWEEQAPAADGSIWDQYAIIRATIAK